MKKSKKYLSEKDLEKLEFIKNETEYEFIKLIVKDINKLKYKILKKYNIKDFGIINYALNNYISMRSIENLFQYLRTQQLETFDDSFKKNNSNIRNY